MWGVTDWHKQPSPQPVTPYFGSNKGSFRLRDYYASNRLPPPNLD
jgi:hypothetical protein